MKPSDTARKFDPTTHNHVVFVRKHKFFKVPLADKNGRELSVAELEVQIERVIALAGSEKASPVGALTSENRDTWADVRIHGLASVQSSDTAFQARTALLAASPSNAASLEEIESAMIIVPLDDIAPITREDASWACWVGDGRNRFYDKHQCVSSTILCVYFSD